MKNGSDGRMFESVLQCPPLTKTTLSLAHNMVHIVILSSSVSLYKFGYISRFEPLICGICDEVCFWFPLHMSTGSVPYFSFISNVCIVLGTQYLTLCETAVSIWLWCVIHSIPNYNIGLTIKWIKILSLYLKNKWAFMVRNHKSYFSMRRNI
jgi:hypothetical protein